MKKAYIKPAIVFESFTLSTSIAGDCEKIVGTPSKEACGIPGSDGENVFSQTVIGADGCQVWNEEDEWDGFCYHVPTEKYTLFNS